MLRGVFPVLSTPFLSDGSCDIASLSRLITYTAQAGAPGLVYPAIASEFATLTSRERHDLVQVVLAESALFNLKVIVGISSASAEASAALGRQAVGDGAAAVMLMAPQSVGSNPASIINFFAAACVDLGDTPVILQNAPPPLGSSLPVPVVLQVLRAVPAIQYVKEENLPCGQRMTMLLDGAPASLRGVMGGAGGRFVVEEYLRGACGSMPSCELVEAHVHMWDMFLDGDVHGARVLLNRLMPLLNLGSIFRQASVKRVLAHRGLVTSPVFRDSNPALDSLDCRELDAIIASLHELMTVTAERRIEKDLA